MSTRPSRNAPPPPPTANALYCHTCGRIITPRKTPTPSTSTPQKYCSARCRRQKPRPGTNTTATATGTRLETLIERTFVRLLGLGDGSERRVVECGVVEREVFGGEGGGGGEEDCGGGAGGGAGGEDDDDDANDDDDDDDDGGVPIPSLPSPSPPPPPHSSGRYYDALTSQQRGVLKARQREMVRQAARRGVAFGFEIAGEEGRRKVDCVKGGRVVESSFARGEWGVRWRV